VTVRAVAAVPAAPMLLPQVSARQPEAVATQLAALRRATGEVLTGLPPVDTVVLVVGAEDATLPDGGCVDLAGYGYPQVRGDVPIDRELLRAVATGTNTPRVRADLLTGDLAVLALQIAAVRPEVEVLPVTVAATARPPALGGMAAGLLTAVERSGRDVAVVAAGDLSASRDTTSPGYLVEGATGWDEAMLAALATVDLDAVAELGPGEARRVAARGWAPLALAAQLARAVDLRFERLELHAPRGVGQLVGSSS
jgi:hypothetical protein